MAKLAALVLWFAASVAVAGALDDSCAISGECLAKNMGLSKISDDATQLGEKEEASALVDVSSMLQVRAKVAGLEDDTPPRPREFSQLSDHEEALEESLIDDGLGEHDPSLDTRSEPGSVRDFMQFIAPHDKDGDGQLNRAEYDTMPAAGRPDFDLVDEMIAKDESIAPEELQAFEAEEHRKQTLESEQMTLEKAESEATDEKGPELQQEAPPSSVESTVHDIVQGALLQDGAGTANEDQRATAKAIHEYIQKHNVQILQTKKEQEELAEQQRRDEERIEEIRGEPLPKLLQRYEHWHREGDHKVESHTDGHLINVDALLRVLAVIHDQDHVNRTLHYEVRRMVHSVKVPPARVSVTACLRGVTKMFGPGFCWRKGGVATPECPSGWEKKMESCVKNSCRRRNFYIDEGGAGLMCKTGCDENRRRYWRDRAAMCYQDCDSNYNDLGLSCQREGWVWIDSYTKNIKPYHMEVPRRLAYWDDEMTCPREKPRKIAGLCYNECGGTSMLDCGPAACSQSLQICAATIAEMVLNAFFAIAQTTALVVTAGGSSASTAAASTAKNSAKNGIMKKVMLEYKKKALAQFTTKAAFQNHVMKMTANKVCGGFAEGIFKQDFTPTLKDFDITGISASAEACDCACKTSDQCGVSCSKAVLGAAGAFDPTGIVSLAATFIHPECSDEDELQKILAANKRPGCSSAGSHWSSTGFKMPKIPNFNGWR